MKNYKLLLIAIVLLLLLILTGVISWLWFSNNKDNDPLPIMTPQTASLQSINGIENAENQETEIGNNTVYIRAEKPLQIPLDAVIVRFEGLYPHLQIKANYVPNLELFNLIKNKSTDIIIADHKLSLASISKLQSSINKVANQSKMLASFSYAIKDSELMDGVILTDNPLAISFRNFIISSSGQDVLQQYDYDNIDGYQNSVDDLFNPTTKSKTAVDRTKVVANALNNSE